MNPEYKHIVTVNWSYPVPLESLENRDECRDYGIYYISRKIYRQDVAIEKAIYIGETLREFRKRLAEHEKNESEWTLKNGEKFVRFGTIKIREEEKYDLKKLLRDIESAIINEIIGLPESALVNISQTGSFTQTYKLSIRNTGYRGLIPPLIEYRRSPTARRTTETRPAELPQLQE